MVVTQPVATLVLLADAVEQVRPGKFAVRGLLPLPGRGTEVLGAGAPVHVAHVLDAEDAGRIVMPGLDVAHRAQHRH